MNGMKYYRLKGRFCKEQVIQATGICRSFLDELEEDTEHVHSCKYYMALAKFYGVFVEELLAVYPDDAVEPGDQYVRPSSVDPCNCLEAWRRAHNLNYEQVAERLGLGGRKAGRQACKARTPKLAHLKKLARQEGMHMEDFLQKYDGWAEADEAPAE